MILRIITFLALLLMLFSCWWQPDKSAIIEEQESPLISSLKDSSLPCFKCHPYEKFSKNKLGKFSHQDHSVSVVHCNQCHAITAHKGATINLDFCNTCHKLTNFSFDSSGMPVNFPHQDHAKKYNCSECHPENFNMKKGSSKITMDEMYKGNFCGRCHNGKISFASTDCNKCHVMTSFKKEISYSSGKVAPAIFSHELHTGMFECNDCHTSIFKYKKGSSGMKMAEIYKSKFCATCHNNDIAFGVMKCRKCHK
jgi:c(7)-type cytochrome triheme protein